MYLPSRHTCHNHIETVIVKCDRSNLQTADYRKIIPYCTQNTIIVFLIYKEQYINVTFLINEDKY